MLALAWMAVACLATTVSAQLNTDLMVTTESDGYARMILTFPTLPGYKVQVVSGVLVLEFDDAISTVLDDTTVKSPEFIVVGRRDPDGKALRFALAQNVRVNTMEAGEQLFIDLLPQNWQGVAPGLPPEVVAELARRAEAAEKAAEIEARRRALENSKYRLRIHVGQQPTFSRIVFDWGAKVGVKLSRKGNVITVAFDQLAKPPMGRLKSDPPRYVEAAKSYFDDEGLKIDLTVNKDSDVRGFREENTYVVDISAPPGLVNQDNEPVANINPDDPDAEPQPRELIELNRETLVIDQPTTSAPATVKVEQPPSKPQAKVEMAEPEMTAEAANTADAMPAKTEAPEEKPSTDDPAAQNEEHEAVPEVIVGEFYLNADGTDLASADEALTAANEPADMPAAPEAPADQPTEVAVEAPAFSVPKQVEVPAEPEAPSPASEPEMAKPEVDGPVVATAERDGDVLRISFPFERATPAAVFTRSGVLWLVFESKQAMDLSGIARRENDHFSKVFAMASGDTQIVRFYVSDTTLASTAVEDKTWVLSLANLVVTPTAPVSLKRGLRSDGRAKISVTFKGASRVHRVKDPEVGDTLSVVTGLGPQRGMVKPQNFVEFSVLKTAHGLAVQPLTDDLRVRLRDDEVLITRGGGLTLSSSRISDLNDAQSGIADNSRPGFIDYESWSPGGPSKFVSRMYQLEHAIATLEPAQTLGPRLDLARLYLANNLGSEAMGHLKLIAETDPELQSEPMFAALRGIAHVLMHRPKQARQDLSSFGLKDDPHSALWRGIMANQQSKWSEAVGNFQRGEYAISEYPEAQQARFRVAAMRAAVESNDFATADFHYKLLPKIMLPSGMAAEVQVLRGRLLDGLGRSIEAFDVLKEALISGDNKSEAEALYHYALLGRRLDKLSKNEVQAKLETVAAIWRGDDLELNTLRRLAGYYVDKEDFRDALRVMKVAVTNYPKAQLSTEIHDDMTALFEDLYLNERADTLKPVEALALYYEYRELTPVGRRGDEMIRKLADRLISVDLLDQAVEILNHQVDKRLIGAARAQVAAKLAMVHLMNRNPGNALKAIRRTRQAVLPQHIQLQRRLIEARALSELNRTDAAVDLLAHLDGDEAVRQRAEAYWSGERWQKAGELFETILADAARGNQPLTGLQRVDVLRSAISYVLADDKIGLDRLRGRFDAKMADTPDESAFKVVTRPINRDSIAFRNLAKEIAAIDTLEAFLSKFKETFDGLSQEADATPAQ